MYDGHGGMKCSDFLRDNLHQFITNNKFFPNNPSMAIKMGVKEADEYFLSKVNENGKMESSGSCAILCLFVGK